MKKNLDVSSSSIENDVFNLTGTMVGALTGFIIGGPLGAVVGSSTVPAITLTSNVLNKALQRKSIRIHNLIENAFEISEKTPEEIINILDKDDEKTDDLLNLIKLTLDTNPEIDNIFSNLISKIILSETVTERDRLIIISDSLKDLKLIHILVLQSINEEEGVLEATKIADKVKIPEVELRSVVRHLELKGFIKDLEVHPIQWKLRELGIMLLKMIEIKG